MSMKYASLPILFLLTLTTLASLPVVASSPSSFDINTLAGKNASVNSTPGLFIRLSAFVQQEADASDLGPPTATSSPITPAFVLSSPLDGSSITPPDVTVNQDTAAATQNEPAIAVNPNNPNQIVAAANDYVSRTWSCTISGTPCSALGDAYSGTYISNDGGTTWCCTATDPEHLGTLIPGVEHLTGGPYDAGGDPALAFDARGNVFFSGLGFDRLTPPNTVEVSKGTISSGVVTWGSPTFINPTTSPSILNDKEWIGVDSHAGSPFANRVYVSWTRFVFNPFNGAYKQSPIFFVYSSDGGSTFSALQSIVGNVIYDQGSRIVVGADGTVYVFWEGSTRLATVNSIWMTKSTDGGATFSTPVPVSPLIDISSPQNTVFRVNSFPAADISPSGQLYVAWSAEVDNGATSYGLDTACFLGPSAGCHSAAAWSTSTDGGATWSTPSFLFPSDETADRATVGYPVTQPDGSGSLTAPSVPVESFFPAVAVASNGNVYVSAYKVDVESPWQRCAKPASPVAVGRINCLLLGNYINNGRLDYAVADLTTGTTNVVSTHPVNSRYQFGGGFIGDYTDLAVGSDNVFHAVWTDTNNVQTVVWWYGFQFTPTPVHQQDIATATGNF